MNNLFYRAYNTQTHRMYFVVGIRWSAAIPGQIDSMELVNPIDHAYRVFYRGEHTFFEEFILMPGTSLKDKHGTMIYADDVLIHRSRAGNTLYHCVMGTQTHNVDGLSFPYHGVHFLEMWGLFPPFEQTSGLASPHVGELEIIGNVHQNPDLLTSSGDTL